MAQAGCPVVLMHHQGTPETMQDAPRYGDALIEVYDWLEARIEAAVAAGIDRARILIDPGIGFGKRGARTAWRSSTACRCSTASAARSCSARAASA